MEPHSAHSEARKKLVIVRKQAHTTWAAHEKTLTTGYSLDYGSPGWTCTAKTNQNVLDNVHAERLATGAMKSTPILI